MTVETQRHNRNCGGFKLLRLLACTVILVSSALLAHAASAQDTPQPIPIAEGQSIGQSQFADQSISYEFNARREQAYRIEVIQDGLDVVVTVSDSGGDSRSYNSPLRRDESELVVLQPDVDGVVRIDIGSSELTEAQGSHTIRIVANDGASDDRRLAAWRLMSEGAAAYAAGDEGSMSVARNLYIAAAEIWAAIVDERMQAQALYSLAMLDYWQFEDWNSAIDLADQAASLYRKNGQTALYANAIFLRAYARIETASGENEADVYESALASFDEAREIHESLGHEFETAHILNFVGITHWYRADSTKGDFDTARRYYNQSIALFSGIGEWREELNGLQNIVVLDFSEGKRLQGIGSLEKILQRLPPGRDPELRAIMLSNLGTVHLAFSNIDEALLAHSDSLAIYESINDPTGQGNALKNIGQTYYAFGDFDGAERFLDKAMEFAEKSDDRRTQANILSIQGNIAFARRDYALALKQHRKSATLSSSSEKRARRILLLARDLAALGRHEEAINESLTARDESRSEVTRADALQQLALSHIATGDFARGLEYLDEASIAFDELRLPGRKGDVLHGYSLAARANGDLEAAAEYGRAALEMIAVLRERVAHPELRALSSATRRGYFEHQVDVLMALHEASGEDESRYLLRALTVNEKGRARMTNDLLSEAAVELNRGMDPDMVEERQGLYDALAEKHQLQERSDTADEHRRLSAEMDEIENRIRLLETEFRRKNPEFVGFSSAHSLTAEQIQSQIDSDTLLLQYALGEQRSFLWAVTSDSIRVYELDSRAMIEESARSVYADLRLPPGSRKFRDMQERMSALSTQVLGPVSELVDQKARLLVAADGALQYIPFAALPIPSQQSSSSYTPLVLAREDTEIVNVVSMSVRHALASSEARLERRDTIAIFADPVMQASDSRFPSGTTVEVSELTTRSGAGPALPRIPYTGEEAVAIAAMLPESDSLLALGFSASLDTVRGSDLLAYRYIHFATHGIADSEYPALSALVLSQFDEYGQPQQGYLRLHDIYALRLNADVVVLSACETGLGQEIRGESLIGMTQGFMYAGAKSLVASLWQVPDYGTSALMQFFYDGLLNKHLSPSRALSEAQRSMVAERGRSDPYFWGAFVIQGVGGDLTDGVKVTDSD